MSFCGAEGHMRGSRICRRPIIQTANMTDVWAIARFLSHSGKLVGRLILCSGSGRFLLKHLKNNHQGYTV